MDLINTYGGSQRSYPNVGRGQEAPPPVPTRPLVSPRASMSASSSSSSQPPSSSSWRSPNNQQQQQQPLPSSPQYVHQSSSGLHVASIESFTEMVEVPDVKLAVNLQERKYYDDLCDFYALLVAMERLETAYVRDCDAKSYTKTCNKLIAQYKAMSATHGWGDGHIQAFLSQYKIDTCKAAAVRLSLGVPATLLYGGNEAESKGKELIIFQCVQTFITTMDSLKLEIRAVDELFPGLRDLVENLNHIPELPRDHEVHTQVQKWLGLMAQMRATEELTDEQARQMAFDLDSAYGSLHRFIKDKSKPSRR